MEKEASQRVVIIRGPMGEVIIDSSNMDDTLENMARLARDQYEKGDIQVNPSYIR